jgi:hypothetical protein
MFLAGNFDIPLPRKARCKSHVGKHDRRWRSRRKIPVHNPNRTARNKNKIKIRKNKIKIKKKVFVHTTWK